MTSICIFHDGRKYDTNDKRSKKIVRTFQKKSAFKEVILIPMLKSTGG